MYLNYKDGKLNSVTISATVYITGPGIKDAKEGNAMANNLTKETANTFIDSKNVTFDVNYKYRSSVDANKLGAGENVLNFSDKKNNETNGEANSPASNNNIPMAGNSGTVYANYKNMTRTALHETGHLIGLPDGYFNIYTSSNTNDGPTEPEVRLGYDNDIMMHSNSKGGGPREFNAMYYQKYWGKANLYTGYPQVNCTKRIGYNPKGVLNNNSYKDGLEPRNDQIKP